MSRDKINIIDYDAEPFTPPVNDGRLLCPQCKSEHLRVEKTTFELSKLTRLTLETKKDEYGILSEGIVEVIHDNKKYEAECNLTPPPLSYTIYLWYRCSEGDTGIIEIVYLVDKTLFVHRPFADWNNMKRKEVELGKVQ